MAVSGDDIGMWCLRLGGSGRKDGLIVSADIANLCRNGKVVQLDWTPADETGRTEMSWFAALPQELSFLFRPDV